MNQTKVEKLPLGKMILFALGQMGWSLAAFGVSSLVNYFYMPPEEFGKAAIFPVFVYPGLILGVFTVIGLVNAGGRLFDAVTNPIIATWSDRCESKLGRRRFYMLISAIPFSLFGVLVYMPPVGYAHWINIAWLAVTVLLFYFFFVMYTIPYTALISELGHTPDERLTISTVIGVTWALGFLVGNLVYALQPLYQSTFGMTSVAAFQAVLATFGVVSSILMFLPIIFIDEYKYAEFHVSNENMIEALKSTFRNKYFVKYISSELFYWICLNIIQAGLVYYVTTLLGLEKSIVSALMAVMFLLSFVYYLPINIVARKFQKKIVVQFAFIVFSIVFFLAAGMGILPIPAMVYAFGIVIISALPIAIFGILPNAIVADIAEADGIVSGNYKAGIFFGVRTFEMNVGISIANILFPSFLALGKSVENPFGIHLSAIVAGVFCLIGFGIFMLYNEKEVLQTISSKKI